MKFFVFFAVLLTANLVLITAIVLRNPTLSAESQTRSSFPIAVGFFIALIFAGLAYYLDFNRMFFYAAAIGAAITSTMIFDNPISYMIAGFPMVIIGLIYLSRFIKTYPKPDKVLNHGS